MPTHYRIIISLIILVGASLGLWLFSRGPHITILKIGDEQFSLEVVDTPQSRSIGLSGRDDLATSTGMLFVFEEPGIYSFWMKDMAFSIDIAWINSDWCVVDIAHNVSPESFPSTLRPSEEALFVLEVPAGVFGSKKIGVSYCFQPPRI